eukprot:jgi/Ulvmu1/3845/UM018_0061.1
MSCSPGSSCDEVQLPGSTAPGMTPASTSGSWMSSSITPGSSSTPTPLMQAMQSSLRQLSMPPVSPTAAFEAAESPETIECSGSSTSPPSPQNTPADSAQAWHSAAAPAVDEVGEVDTVDGQVMQLQKRLQEEWTARQHVEQELYEAHQQLESIATKQPAFEDDGYDVVGPINHEGSGDGDGSGDGSSEVLHESITHENSTCAGGKAGEREAGQAIKSDMYRLQQDVVDLAAQVSTLMSLLLEARAQEAALEHTQQQCCTEIAAAKDSIRRQAQECQQAVQQVLELPCRTNHGVSHDSPEPQENAAIGIDPTRALQQMEPPGNATGAMHAGHQDAAKAAKASAASATEMCARIAALEAEVEAQRQATVAAMRANAALTGRLRGTPTTASVPQPQGQFDSDAGHTAHGQTVGVEGLKRTDMDTCSDSQLQLCGPSSPGTRCAQEQEQHVSHEQTPCCQPGSDHGVEPGLLVLQRQSAANAARRDSPWKPAWMPGGGQLASEHCWKPCGIGAVVSTPQLHSYSGSLGQASLDSIQAKLMGSNRPASTPRQAIPSWSPAASDSWTSPGLQQPLRLSPVLRDLPAHMRQFAPPGILAALGTAESPGRDSRHVDRTGGLSVQAAPVLAQATETRPTGHELPVRSPFGSIMGSSAQHSQAYA